MKRAECVSVLCVCEHGGCVPDKLLLFLNLLSERVACFVRQSQIARVLGISLLPPSMLRDSGCGVPN